MSVLPLVHVMSTKSIALFETKSGNRKRRFACGKSHEWLLPKRFPDQRSDDKPDRTNAISTARASCRAGGTRRVLDDLWRDLALPPSSRRTTTELRSCRKGLHVAVVVPVGPSATSRCLGV